MALYTKKEFAQLCKMETKALSVYISPKRKKVIATDDGLIDSENEINKAFIAKHAHKSNTAVKLDEVKIPKQIPREETYIEPEDDEGEFEDNEDDIPPYHISEQKLKHLDTKKREREIALLKIKEDKIRGTVIPSELVKPVFLQHNQSIITAMKNMMDEKLREIAKKHSLSVNEVADIKGNWVAGLNESIDKATRLSIKAVDNIISEHSEKKSVGERG